MPSASLRHSPSGKESSVLELESNLPNNRFAGPDGEFRVPGGEIEPDATYWLDAATGSDDFDGSEDFPFATTEKAWERIGTMPTASMITVNVGPGTYNFAPFRYVRNIRKNVRFRGQSPGGLVPADLDQKFADVAITSQTGIVINCSGAAPGWTVDQWMGRHVWIYDSTGTTLIDRYTIAENTADALIVMAPKNTNAPAGSIARIGIPAAQLILSSASIDVSSQSAVIGGSLSGNTFSVQNGIRPSNGLIWENIAVVASAGVYPSYFFTNAHAFVGCVFQTSAANFGAGLYFDRNSVVWSGTWAESGGATQAWFNGTLTNRDMAGYCLSVIDTVTPQFGGVVHVEGNFRGALLCGSLTVNKTGETWLTGGFRVNAAAGYAQYAAIESRGNCQIYDSLEASNGDCYGATGWTGNSLPSVYAHENGELEIFGPEGVKFYGTGDVAFTRDGWIRLGDFVPVFPEAGTHGGLAIYGGQIRLNGGVTNYNWLGPCTISQTNPLTRPAGAWAVNESVISVAAGNVALWPTDGMPAIYRTS